MNANFLRMLMLAGWTFAFLWLLGGNRYEQYLSPKLWPLIAIGLVFGLLFTTAIFLRSARHERVVESGVSQFAKLGLLCLPLAYLAATSSTAGLGAESFRQRFVGGAGFAQRDTSIGMLGGGKTERGAADAFDEMQRDRADGSKHGPDFQPSVMGAVIPEGQVSLLRMFEEYERYAGKKVTFEGIAFHDERVPADKLVVFRFVVTCCVADAFPLAVLVDCEEPSAFETDSWVRVTGKPSKTQFEGDDWMLISETTVRSIEAPDRPYLSRF